MFENIAQNIGYFMLLLAPIILWEGIWKAIGAWKAARNNQIVWFVFIFITNTLGILPILYILFFQKKSRKK